MNKPYKLHDIKVLVFGRIAGRKWQSYTIYSPEYYSWVLGGDVAYAKFIIHLLNQEVAELTKGKTLDGSNTIYQVWAIPRDIFGREKAPRRSRRLERALFNKTF